VLQSKSPVGGSGCARQGEVETVALEISMLQNGVNECFFYEKVIKVKADVAALLNLFSDVSIDVRW